MADKPEFVDMISEATAASPAPGGPARRGARGQGNIAPQSLAAGSMGAVADRDAHALEAQILEVPELELSTANLPQMEVQAPIGRLIHFNNSSGGTAHQ